MKKTATTDRRTALKQLTAWSGSTLLFWVPRFTAVSQPTFAPTAITRFCWSGAITPTSAVVVAQLAHHSTAVRLLASTRANLSQPQFSPAVATVGDRLAKLTVDGLQPNRRYYYALEVDGVVDTATIGRFHTHPIGPHSFHFACASCAQTGSSHPVFNTIRQQNPRFFLHMGDMHYENITANDINQYQAAYSRVWASPNQAALYRDIPLVYTWDDHDYGANSSDKTSPSRSAARQAYQLCVPHYPLIQGAGEVPINQAFTIGRVRFLLTDGRSKRSPIADPDNSEKTVLGYPQKTWFMEELLAAQERYALTIWVNTVPWIGASLEDGWGRYQTERTELSNFIQAHNIKRLLMVSGDAHMIAIDDGSNNKFATNQTANGFPVFHAAALDSPPSSKGGPYSHGTYPGGGQFGRVDISDTGGSTIRVTLTGLNENNIPLTQYSFDVAAPPPKRLFLPTLIHR